jgi:hypothetical protein
VTCVALLEHLFAIIQHMVDTPGGPIIVFGSAFLVSRRLPKI